MTATNYSTGNVDERKMYCSENYNSDPLIYDSTQAFYLRNYGQNRNVQRADSVYLREEAYQLRSEELGKYENVGFTCTCAK